MTFALERREFVVERMIVSKGKFLRFRFEKIVERVQHRHLGDQIHLDAKFARRLFKNNAGGVIGLRILLPVDVMLFRFDLERVTQNARARMRRGAEPHNLRAEVDEPVVFVMGLVMERDVDRH